MSRSRRAPGSCAFIYGHTHISLSGIGGAGGGEVAALPPHPQGAWDNAVRIASRAEQKIGRHERRREPIFGIGNPSEEQSCSQLASHPAARRNAQPQERLRLRPRTYPTRANARGQGTSVSTDFWSEATSILRPDVVNYRSQWP